MTQMIWVHWNAIWPKGAIITRRNSAIAAILADEAKKAVTGVGAPSYTSGVHIWNGTAAHLKAMPTERKTRPTMRPTFGMLSAAVRMRGISSKLVEPEKP